MFKIIISGGGTGGHIYPGIAVANKIKELHPDARILFVGAKGKMEMLKVPQAGYQIMGLPIRGLQRKIFSLDNLRFPFRMLGSLIKANTIIHEYEPDIVIGTGGYASAAITLMSAINRIPTIIQEQNGYAGLTNKLLSKFVDKICVAYPHMERYFPKEKIVFTGNPIRKDIIDTEYLREEGFKLFGLDPNKKTLLVLGGSLGARTINNSIAGSAQFILGKDTQIIWQTGKNYFHKVQKTVAYLPQDRLYVNEFIYEMHLAYACADIVVSRAGALTISELAVAKKPVILIPSPNVAEDHQNKNAQALASEKAALLVSDQDAPRKLPEKIVELMNNISLQKDLSTNIQKFARPNAADDIVAEIVKFLNKR